MEINFKKAFVFVKLKALNLIFVILKEPWNGILTLKRIFFKKRVGHYWFDVWCKTCEDLWNVDSSKFVLNCC